MSAIASCTAMQLAILFMLSTMGGRSVAMDESVSYLPDSSSSISLGQLDTSAPVLVDSMQRPRYSSLVGARIPFLGGKRSYTLRSEYKRLPVYQFGIGKRWAESIEDKRSHRYSFGVGKRAKDYTFGVGKRGKHYAFGVGKRTKDYTFGVGKREKDYSFGVGKREKDYTFGVGKREKGYAFGLGKRYGLDEMDIARLSYAGYLPRDFYSAYAQGNAYDGYAQSKRSSHFNFGLGKRDVDLAGEDDYASLHEQLPAKHQRDKYLFGIGKRFLDEENNDDDEEEELS